MKPCALRSVNDPAPGGNPGIFFCPKFIKGFWAQVIHPFNSPLTFAQKMEKQNFHLITNTLSGYSQQ